MHDSGAILLRLNEYFFKLLETIDRNKIEYLQDNKKSIVSLSVNISRLSEIVDLMSNMNYSEEDAIVFKSLYSLMSVSLTERQEFLSSISY